MTQTRYLKEKRAAATRAEMPAAISGRQNPEDPTKKHIVNDKVTAPISVEIRSNDKDSTCKLEATPSVKIAGKAGPTKPWPKAKVPNKSVRSSISELSPVATLDTHGSSRVAIPTNAIPGTKTDFGPHRSDHSATGFAQQKHKRFVAAKTIEKPNAPKPKDWVSINGTKQYSVLAIMPQ